MKWVLFLAMTLLVSARAAGPARHPEGFNDDDLIVFKPGIFTGNAFPGYDFEHPEVVKGLIGPYQLKASFYGADFKPVQSAEKPGRYGAIVEIHTVNGLLEKRYVTIYKTASAVDWHQVGAGFSASRQPAGFGLDPGVVNGQLGTLDASLRQALEHKVAGEVTQPQALAALRETKSGSRRWTNPGLGWAQAVDQVWWDQLRDRIGDLYQLKYLSFLPVDYEKETGSRPLVIFLSGSGERGDDLDVLRKNSVVQELTNSAASAIVIVPQCPWDDLWMTTPLNRMLDEVMKKYRVDADRVYLTGLSLGGYATWAWGIANPERFAALVPMSSAGDPDGAERIKRLPIWAFHGGKDENVSVEESRSMVSAVRAAKGNVKLTIYPEAGHDCWNRAYGEPELYTWMFAQRRGQPAAAPAGGK